MHVSASSASSLAVGTTMGLFSTVISDDLLNFVGKLLLGVAVAVVSASVHALTKKFWQYVFRDKRKKVS